MQAIEVFSPHLPNIGKKEITLKRTILVLSVVFDKNDIIVSFSPKDKDLFLDFLQVCRKTVKTSDNIIVHIMEQNKWIKANQISDIGNNALLLIEPIEGGRFVGGNITEV